MRMTPVFTICPEGMLFMVLKVFLKNVHCLADGFSGAGLTSGNVELDLAATSS